ncbi:EAL domain, c-di-GMP-specific phosphodiesterase class I (or its enzymatically inactive variant) [Asanoa hainanensis]|uniref:EAL domain, c-di-GMP-specific phosphodiesterase class I (Or its enzymatically inactive variant) n=1 Tax=Asanoa hainanensis TaxID=560556 RepID=A0A239KQB3_9ACTN|nr:EAL domain-containing protein [Asanoa hainanensis]SNT20200.1 EAL domain, c-di-GMP-specific phosphodiesterase class I (or its enzymatically inactive variant) [Asanoa hainanensis]
MAVEQPRDDEFEAILRDRAVYPVFQPVVSIADRCVVGFEALARGPAGRYEAAPALFEAAARLGRSADLNWLCAGVAGESFLSSEFADLALFVNFDPLTLRGPFRDRLLGVFADLMRERQVVIEITERAVTQDPPALMDAVIQARRLSARVALDDVGVEPSSLAAMPLVNPDIIKIDRSVVQAHSSTWAVSHVVNAVLHEAARSGAQILAEGIEDEGNLEVAKSLGATLAQGYLFGRPGPLPASADRSALELARVTPRQVPEETPFEMLSRTDAVNFTTPPLLAAMTGHIENQALHTSDAAILVVNLADAANLDDEARLRYGYITTRGIEVYVLGHGIERTPAGRARGVPLAADDPLVHERTVLFIGSHYASGVFAREQDDGFEAGVCYDRERVVEATLPLVRRLNR